MPTLSASAYVVLGLLEQQGATTPYALDREIQQSVGNFWSFPRSQIYAEAARLVRRGLVVEERESTGRRRRTLSLTQAGRDTLAEWLTGAAGHDTDIRDEGLLRLYFQQDASSGAERVRQLAVEQRDAHRRKLAEYETILASVPAPSGAALDTAGPGSRFEPTQAAVLAFGLRFEELAVAFWTEVAERGASVVDPRPRE
ncbi:MULTISPECIES: PadR family transcriptional regulator [unclassified Streptomyces]|uniref:PadR family transcriptional regulator n=1 Tax=unclassified Streptomyces TaxID=2593676 RepID=UPI0024422456|nr:PadR family transcriptional regulator [Streptomyces sp. DH41]MDG9722110.1 PadR family transcriptional regulator [Streptomyces sp. DH41]